MSFTMRLIAALSLLLMGLVATPASPAAAQESGARFGDENISVQLYADGAPVPGEEWTLALRFKPSAPRWHGYWSNPGDAGQGMTLNLDLPDGWTMGEPAYPVPQTLVIAGLMNHIYEGDYTVLIPVDVPPSADVAAAGAITGFIEYLACTDEICVPQDAVLRLRTGGNFAEWRADIAPMLDAQANFAVRGDRLLVTVPLPRAVDITAPHIFIGQNDLVVHGERQRFRRTDDRLIAELTAIDRDITPQMITGILAFGDGRGVRFFAKPGPVPAGGEVVDIGTDTDFPPFWTLLAAAFAGGLILNVMPCVFPILSLKALSLARAGAGARAARTDAVAYTGGVVAACTALGAIMLALRAAGEQVGWAFQLQEPAIVLALFVLSGLITANLAGLFELPSIPITRDGAPAGAFLTGLLAAVAATPCTGPFMAAAIGAALLLPAWMALALFAVLGLGLALPFILIAFIPAIRNLLPQPGAWMNRFRRALAIPMGLTFLALAWLLWRLGGVPYVTSALGIAIAVLGIVFAAFMSENLRKSARVAVFSGSAAALGALLLNLPSLTGNQKLAAQHSILEPEEFSDSALTRARTAGSPVFVWFTADWCVTCKVNERVAIERGATRAAFDEANVTALRGDWTRRDEEIADFLASQGAAGIPLYLWYDAEGRVQQLPQILTPDSLITLARQAEESDPQRGNRE